MTKNYLTLKQRDFFIGFARRFGVLVNEDKKDKFEVIYCKNLTPSIIAEIRRFAGCSVIFKEVDTNFFNKKLIEHYETASSEAMQLVGNMDEELDLYKTAKALENHTQDLLEAQDDAPIIRLINAILSEALKEGASDIHIETFEEGLAVRFRVDGILRIILEPPKGIAPLLVSRVKVMAKLDIAERRLPQDGRISLRIGGRLVDIRVSTMPTRHGERIVLRILEKDSKRLQLSGLGLEQQELACITRLLKKPHGIILVTGPTGAGKTTTLYAALAKLNETSRNILTVEDPVEYDLPGIGQTQINHKVEMTFAKGLRAILRQDPDIVMVGEIRDIETAEIAIQASLTGHLVLSTLHTNTAIGAITRLCDMGVERFLLATSLNGVIAQRLVRVLCKQCRVKRLAETWECRLLDADSQNPPMIYHAVGCEHCNNTGYSGRIGIYEIVEVDEKLRQLIVDGDTEMALAKQARLNMPSMRRDGSKKVLAGLTTLEEVLRVTSED